MSNFSDDEEYEIDKLFQEIDLGQQDTGFGNHDDALFPISQVPLFSPVGSPTERSDDGVPSVTLEQRGGGVLRTGGGSSQDPNPAHNATPEEEIRTVPETQNTGHSETLDSVIMDVDGEPLSKMKLSDVLRRRDKLRKRLLKVEHHTQFLETCRQDGLVPKGLKINTQVHPTRGDEPSDTPSKIDAILKQAEQDMVDTLVTHYHQVSESTTARLGDLERELVSRPAREQDEISLAADKTVRDEDDLKSSLERTRKSKLSALHRAHHRPPRQQWNPRQGTASSEGGPHTIHQGIPETVPPTCHTGPPIVTCTHSFPVCVTVLTHTIICILLFSFVCVPQPIVISLAHTTHTSPYS